MELERLQIVDAIKGYKSKSVSWMHTSYTRPSFLLCLKVCEMKPFFWLLVDYF